MIISYKLSGKSIGALKKKGLSDKAVTELRSMEDVYFESPETFIQRVNQLESADEIMTREKQLLKAAKGYFASIVGSRTKPCVNGSRRSFLPWSLRPSYEPTSLHRFRFPQAR